MQMLHTSMNLHAVVGVNIRECIAKQNIIVTNSFGPGYNYIQDLWKCMYNHALLHDVYILPLCVYIWWELMHMHASSGHEPNEFVHAYINSACSASTRSRRLHIAIIHAVE